MSHIFVATELANNRTVVIKVVAPEHAGEPSPTASREVKFAARLKHANIVPLLSAGDANGIAYYTMPSWRGARCASAWPRGDAIPLAEATGSCATSSRFRLRPRPERGALRHQAPSTCCSRQARPSSPTSGSPRPSARRAPWRSAPSRPSPSVRR
ncbi:MAG: hypothetical protein IPJ56_05485 [Gemmatimonadetes bacterium]|nr:hypothetical protein [Gemmatimonadota bacterium]